MNGMYLPQKWYTLLTKGQFTILAVFERDVFGKHTFTEIKKIAKEKSSNLIQTALKTLVKQGVLVISRRGNLVFYSLNHDNLLVGHYLGLVQQTRLEKYPKQVKHTIHAVISEIARKNPYCSLLLFGSYASLQHTKESDLDIAILTENKEQHNDYKAVLTSLSLRLLPGVDYQLMTGKEFVDMLLADYENIAKQIYENNIPLYNNTVYYSLVKEARNHGFSR